MSYQLNSNPERENSRYFKKTRTQPFIITFFMAVLAFKKIAKIMRRKLSQKRVAATTRRRSTFLSVVKRSRQSISFAMQGKALIHADIKDEVTTEDSVDDVEHMEEPDEAVAALLAAKSRSVYYLKSHKAEEVSRRVGQTLDRYYARLRNQQRTVPLSDRLDAAVRLKDESPNQKRRPATAPAQQNAMNVPLATGNALQDWNNMQQAVEAAKQPDAKAILEKNLAEAANDIGEYLEGTPIYYGATLALQARHGGYLSYASGDVKASAHKVLSQSRFIVKKSDDLTDIGAVKFGDALWLQTIANGSMASSVLGAVYGSLVDKKREIQPALVSCKRAVMFKAQQYGRWIILNRDDPMGTLGKPVCHLDRIILEQEWCFLASNAPSSSSMFRICENSDDALARKIDLFRPGDECIWRLHLVALPSDDGEWEKQRQQRLQEAKDQIDASEELRLKKANVLLSSLSSFLPDELRDDNYIKEKMKHKATPASEQEYLRLKYRDMEQRDFRPNRESVDFLARVYGPDSSIVAYRREAQRIHSKEYDITAPSSNGTNRGRSLSPGRPGSAALTSSATATITNTTNVLGEEMTPWQTLHQVSHSTQRLENLYWDTAQRLLIDSRSYELLPAVMEEFMDKDRARKQQAARILQAFVRRCLDRQFNFQRSFRRVDKLTRSRLEAKLMLKRRLLLDAGSGGNGRGKNAADAAAVADAVQSANMTGEVNHNVVWKAINRFKEAANQAQQTRQQQGQQAPSVFAQEMHKQQQQIQQDIAEQHAKIAMAEELEAQKVQQQQEMQLYHQQQHDAIAKLRRSNTLRPPKASINSKTSIFTTQLNVDGSNPSNGQTATIHHAPRTNQGPLTEHQQQVAYFQAQYEKYLRKKQYQLLARKDSFIAMSPAALSSAIPAQKAFNSQALFEHVHAQLLNQPGGAKGAVAYGGGSNPTVAALLAATSAMNHPTGSHEFNHSHSGSHHSPNNSHVFPSQQGSHQFGAGFHHVSQSSSAGPMRRTFNSIDSQLFPAAVTRHPHPADHVELEQEAQMPMTTQRLLYDDGLLRPASAPTRYEIAVTHEANPRLTKEDKERESQTMKAALGNKPGRTYGLPDDVFEDIMGPTNIKTGVKFLKAMAKSQSTKSVPILRHKGSASSEALFDDLKVKKRRAHHHQHHLHEGERKARPQSSNAALRRRAADRIL